MVHIHQHSSSQASDQIYVFKLYNINYCEDCPKKLEKALQERFHGIESAVVDASKSLATVKDSIDSKTVIDQIKKWGKKAKLVPEREDANPYGYTVDNSESNASSLKEILDHICRDKYCTRHRRDNYTTSDPVPNVNNGTSHPSLYPGSGNNNPMMNPFVQRSPMYAPPPLPYQGQYYGPRMVPSMAGYSSYAMQRQMPRPKSNGFTRLFY